MKDVKSSRFLGRNGDELVTLLGLSDDDVEKAVGPPHSLGTRVKEEITGALYNFLANLLVNSINQHENTASRLTKQLLVLNINPWRSYRCRCLLGGSPALLKVADLPQP